MHTLDGHPLNAYDEDGFRIVRQSIVESTQTSMLMDLSLAHTLFQTEPDDFGHVRNDVKYTVYPLAFTRNLGNIQSDGVITLFGRRMNIIEAKLRPQPDQQAPQPRRRRRRNRRLRRAHSDRNSDSDISDSDASDVEESDSDSDIQSEDDERQRPPPPLLHAVCSQIYNGISHRVRDAAKFHEVQLGLATSSFAGTTAVSIPSKNRWQRNVDRCRGDLPHARCAHKIAGPDQPQTMRFENTYRLDVQHLPLRKRSGE